MLGLWKEATLGVQVGGDGVLNQGRDNRAKKRAGILDMF